MKSIEVVTEHLKKHDVYFGTGPNLFHFGFEMDNCLANCLLQVGEEYARLTIDGIKCSQERREALGHFALAANLEMAGGHFDLHPATGRFTYVNHILFGEGELAPGMVEQMIGKAVYEYDRFFPGAMKVLYAGEDPFTAVGDCVKMVTAGDVEEIEWIQTMEQLMGSDPEDVDAADAKPQAEDHND